MKFFYYLLYFKWFTKQTFIKSSSGVHLTGRKLLFSRKQTTHARRYVNITNARYFINIPSMSVSFVQYGLFQTYATLFKQSTGLFFTIFLIQPQLFTYYIHNQYSYIPKLTGLEFVQYLGFLSTNTLIYNIVDVIIQSFAFARSFGSFGKILAHESDTGFYLIQLPSLQKRLFFILTQVLIYTKPVYQNKFKLQKAGFFMKRIWRPTVRGVAMNPVDHPHGGRTKSLLCPKTPWGLNTK